MTEEVKKQEAGNLQGSTDKSGDQSESTPQFVTMEQAQAMVNDALKAAESKTQSLVAKSGNRIQASVQEKLANLETALKLQADMGIEITPQQKKQLQNQAVMDALSQVEQEPPPEEGTQQPPPSQGQQQAPPQADAITQAAWAMMQERGIDILENDPEFSELDMTSPYKFLLSVDKAINDKEQRLAQGTSQDEGANQNQQGKFARIPGAGAGSTGSNLMPDGTPPMERLGKFYTKKGR